MFPPFFELIFRSLLMILVYHLIILKAMDIPALYLYFFHSSLYFFHIFRNYTQVSIDIFKHYFRITFLRFVLFFTNVLYILANVLHDHFTTGGHTNMKNTQSAVQTFYRLSWHGLPDPFFFCHILLCFCIRAAEEKPDQCHEHLKFHISVPGRLCNPES